MDDQIKNMIDSRHEANLMILDVIRMYCDKYPEMRFGQALANLGIIEYDDTQQHHPIDPFFDESLDVLKKVVEKYNKSI